MPATGWPGTNRLGAGRCGTTSRTTCALIELTSVTMASAGRPGAHRRRDRADGGRRHAQHDEIGTGDGGGRVGLGPIAQAQLDAHGRGSARCRA